MKKIRVQQSNNKSIYTPWQNKEGVFLIRSGDFICRVKTKIGYSTISKHKTEEEAEKAYQDYQKNN